jgi:hypothetical protein
MRPAHARERFRLYGYPAFEAAIRQFWECAVRRGVGIMAAEKTSARN